MWSDVVTALSANLLSPAVLFFLLGVVATLLRSDLRFPEPLYVGLTIYLLVAIGFKGGVALSDAGLGNVWLPGMATMLLGTLIPLWTYPVLRFVGRMKPVDAAAISAHYGSVSAVTFIAATNYLRSLNLSFPDYASAFLAVMEAPAILVGVVLGKLAGPRTDGIGPVLRKALREASTGRSVLLLVGALIAGCLSGRKGGEATAGLFISPFQGVLALFLLEMGMVAARRFDDLRRVGPFLLVFGVLAPVLNAVAGAWLAQAMGMGLGGTMLLASLAASASYIAAPAAMRMSLPEANPTLYLTSALAITFPFNITIGLPLYLELARRMNPATP